MPGQDVDGPSLTTDLERRFGDRGPAVEGQKREHPLDDQGVVVVEQAIKLLAAPLNSHVEARAERLEDALERPDRRPMRRAALDPRDLGRRHPDPVAELLLRPAAPASKCADRQAESDGIHRRDGCSRRLPRDHLGPPLMGSGAAGSAEEQGHARGERPEHEHDHVRGEQQDAREQVDLDVDSHDGHEPVRVVVIRAEPGMHAPREWDR